MKVSEGYQSGKYLTAAHIGDKRPEATINRTEWERFENGQTKLVLYFANKELGMVLNKTNATVLAHAWGDDPATWLGCTVQIYTEPTQFKSDIVLGLRVRPLTDTSEPAA